MTTYSLAIDSALLCCGIGVLVRMGRWLTRGVGTEARMVGFSDRIRQAVSAMGHCLTPNGFLVVLKVVVLDILLQTHLARANRWRWAMHMAIAWGVVILVAFHAMSKVTSDRLFSDYMSTVPPYLFLRDALGALVLTGIAIALLRRLRLPRLNAVTSRLDLSILGLLAVIVASGIALKSAKIISQPRFNEMVADFMGSEDTDEVAPLRAYWGQDFGVVFFDNPLAIGNPDTLAEGAALHAQYCAACHPRPTSAVVSFPLAQAIAPFARWLDAIDAAGILWGLHVYGALLALALLPLTKFFHLISTPVSLLIRASGPAAGNSTANRATRRAIALDACTHCGVCSTQCRVTPSFQVIGNPAILPSEKILAVARMADGRGEAAERIRLADGHLICTRCGACTRVCPSGIDLQDLWTATGADLNRLGIPEPFQWIRHHRADQWANRLSPEPETAPPLTAALGLSDRPESFWSCIQCTTCTSVCPVVAVSEDTQRDLDWTPQQVMNLLRLQLKDLALGSRMVWDCVTCYQCQEHCPQGVKVADVLYELRNEAYRRLKPDAAPPPAKPDTDESLDHGI